MTLLIKVVFLDGMDNEIEWAISKQLSLIMVLCADESLDDCSPQL